jgi:hypothetical protein
VPNGERTAVNLKSADWLRKELPVRSENEKAPVSEGVKTELVTKNLPPNIPQVNPHIGFIQTMSALVELRVACAVLSCQLSRLDSALERRASR